MADNEQQLPRRRPPNANRGRQPQDRIYQHLGVRDLREIIDRKRTERGHPNETCIPPADPSYNYLKDPLRESTEHEVQEPSKLNNPRKPKNNPSNSFKRGVPSGRGQHRDIENPLNIKVEFSPLTGERSYKFDERTVLPTIKHVPDHASRGPSQASRGRGRGRARSYHTRTIRNNQRQNSEFSLESGRAPVPISGTEETWDDEAHEYPSSKDCDSCENYKDNPPIETVGLEKQVKNLILTEGDNVELGIENKELKH